MPIETNFNTTNDAKLHQAGQRLLDAAMTYWKEYQRACGSAAVVWVDDTDGRMVVLTRFEYKDQLMANIGVLRREEDTRGFDE